jgi:hypothetical protein
VAREITENAFSMGRLWKRRVFYCWTLVKSERQSCLFERQEKDPNSVLNYFRKMVQLHKDNSVLVYGMYTFDEDNPDIYAYTES